MYRHAGGRSLCLPFLLTHWQNLLTKGCSRGKEHTHNRLYSLLNTSAIACLASSWSRDRQHALHHAGWTLSHPSIHALITDQVDGRTDKQTGRRTEKVTSTLIGSPSPYSYDMAAPQSRWLNTNPSSRHESSFHTSQLQPARLTQRVHCTRPETAMGWTDRWRVGKTLKPICRYTRRPPSLFIYKELAAHIHPSPWSAAQHRVRRLILQLTVNPSDYLFPTAGQGPAYTANVTQSGRHHPPTGRKFFFKSLSTVK